MRVRKEYNEIIEGLRQNLELMLSSGILEVPCPPTGQKASVSAPSEFLEEACKKCRLGNAGRSPVSGAGSVRALLAFIGGLPGESSGEPFGGEEGALLAKMIEAMGLNRKDVYLSYAVKCRAGAQPPPYDEEAFSCRPNLEKELGDVSPKIVVAFGPLASLSLLGSSDVGALRGVFHKYGDMKVMATYEPSLLIKNPNLKKDAWQDLQLVMKELKKH